MEKNKDTEKEQKAAKSKKKFTKKTWTTLIIILAGLIVVGGAAGGYMIHLSNTSPQFCATCHLMDRNVTSYLTSNDLDNVHYQAGVQCKECHDYKVPQEIASGIRFVTGNYTVDDNGDLMAVKYDNDMCFQCHISYDHLAVSTDYLEKNPHNNHNGELKCNTCHVSHGDQIDYCSSCHDNGNQRLIGEEIVDRGTIH